MGVVYILLAIIATMIMVRAFFIALMLVLHDFPSPLAIPPPPPLLGRVVAHCLALSLVVVRLLSRRSGGGAKRWRWTAVGSPPSSLLSSACCLAEAEVERSGGGGQRWVHRLFPCCRTLVVPSAKTTSVQQQDSASHPRFATQRGSGVLTASEEKKLRGPFYTYTFKLHLLSLLSTLHSQLS